MLSLLAFSLIAGFVQPSMASDFLYRFYNNGGCNHASLPANTSPPTGTAAAAGSLGPCVNAPAVNVWNAIEISQSNLVVVTFCGADCIGPSGLTADKSCNLPSFSCTTIGSFFVVPVPDFYYRLHDTGGCPFNPLPASSSPPSNQAAGRGNFDSCINIPLGSWISLEANLGDLVIFTFCSPGCPTGTGKSLGEQGTCSSLAGAGCVPQSFIAVSRDGPVA
ncbi:hypothetical protein DFH09DRAFT_1157826 [Mycena vulgaris]|nr:hypothetical protein DFH09DRAFT_1157826 [Mycena vulgaris]